MATTEMVMEKRRCETGEALPVIEVEGLRFAYHDGREVLHGLDLTISQGEKVALVGPNGAGKSTLMLHLNGILGSRDGDGSVRVMSQALNKDNLGVIRAQVGLVFQDPDDQLFSPTVFEDVAFGPLHMGLPEEKVRRQVAWALGQVGMGEYVDRVSHHLSIGEKKRVAIATVLSMTPEILVLDEPTAGLDPRARRSLITLLRKMTQTILVSTHDMRLVAELFPRMMIMDRGVIVADGPTSVLLNDEPLLEAHGLECPWVGADR
jgi:cobalt/nickel transport system ATP-binding protein